MAIKDENKENPNSQIQNDVPVLHQYDPRWANHSYGSGTIASSGCGPTSFTMIARWYGVDITPIEAADFASNGYHTKDGTTFNFYAAAAKNWGFEMKEATQEEALTALKNSYPVIAAHGPGLFTANSHVIVYAKLVGEDKLIVNDPNCNGGGRNNRGDDYQYNLKEVFEENAKGGWKAWIPTTSHEGKKPLMMGASEKAEGGSDAATSMIGKFLSSNGSGFKITSKKCPDPMDGNYVEMKPLGKTYCEPIYPDLIYVNGNIPNSVVTNAAVNNTNKLQKTKSDFCLMTSVGVQALTGLNMNMFTSDEVMRVTQRTFDPTKSIAEVKIPNAGKPLNNNDPYPVDLKIEELELHLPRVKKYGSYFEHKKQHYHEETLEMAKMMLRISDNAEKRIVRLENILATVLRYTFAMGSRMHINCLYYGGQSRFGKYITIRCLKNDLMTD